MEEYVTTICIDETSEAYLTSTAEERRETVADIERAFDENVNYPDYARKLHLIENCIYGVDIQPIAIQISKLRFFISLVIDQKRNDNPADNIGIRPLPNLEAKFVAENKSFKGIIFRYMPIFSVNCLLPWALFLRIHTSLVF